MTVSVYSGLEAMPTGFQALMEQDGHDYVFTSRPWYDNYISHGLDQGAQVRAFAVARDEVPRALLIGVQPRRPFRRKGPRKLRFAHPDQVDLCTYANGGPADSTSVLKAVIDEVSRSKPGYDSVVFEPVEKDSAMLQELEELLNDRGFIVRKHFVCGNWYEDIEQSCFEAYFATRPSRLRNTLKRREKRLQREAVGQFHLVTGGAHLATGYADYVRVTAASWQGLHPMGSEYIRSLMDLAAEQGALRLGLLYVDGKPAAGQVWLVSSGTAACYRLAYDQRFERFSAGSLLTREMFRHVIDVDKVERIDFGIGDDPYKQDWVSRRREMWGIVGYNARTPFGIGGAAWQLVAKPIRAARHAILPLAPRRRAAT